MAEKSNKIWEIVGAMSHTKDKSVLDDPEFTKTYQAFVINRSFSHHTDSILAANLMNERHDLPPALQFLFLLNTLRPRKRYSEWMKNTDPDDVSTVAEYYGCSQRHARKLVALHSSEQLAIIRKRLEKGGASSKRISRNDTT
jgi:hypothetical protein